MPRRQEKSEAQTLWAADTNARIQRSINKWSARFVPLMLIAVVGYSLWAIVVILCINYLIHPPAGDPRRLGAGIAIIVIYFALMIPMSLAYFRVLGTIAREPGFVPRPGDTEKGSRKADRNRQKRQEGAGGQDGVDEEEKNDYLHDPQGQSPTGQAGYVDRNAVEDGMTEPPLGLDFFYKRDIFECETDGMPRWCSTCKMWKPDRSHHSSELGKCVFKMDHFCPWAGGIIAETSFKFFIQFLTYAATFCLFLLIVSAYFTADRHSRHLQRSAPVVSIIAISAFFFTFAFSMAYHSLYATYLNSTTVDNLSRLTKVYHFAVLIPENAALLTPPRAASDDSDDEQYPAHPTSMPRADPVYRPPYRTITYPRTQGGGVTFTSNEPIRTFAILATPAGANPYLLPTASENFKTVMGERWIDWFLPIRHSPCWDDGHGYAGGLKKHADPELGGKQRRIMYKMGPVVDDMIAGVGVSPLQR